MMDLKGILAQISMSVNLVLQVALDMLGVKIQKEVMNANVLMDFVVMALHALMLMNVTKPFTFVPNLLIVQARSPFITLEYENFCSINLVKIRSALILANVELVSMAMVSIAKMLMNVGFFIIIHQKGEFLGLLFIQNTHHQMIATAKPLARTHLVATNVSAMKDGVRIMVSGEFSYHMTHLCIPYEKAFLEVASIVRIEMNVNFVSMTVTIRWVFNLLLALFLKMVTNITMSPT